MRTPISLKYIQIRNKFYFESQFIINFQNYDPRTVPAIGAQVRVKWTDNNVYDGIFEGTNHRIMYNVSFITSRCITYCDLINMI